MINRRGLITGLISLVAAPAIVRVASIMPVKVMLPYVDSGFTPVSEVPAGFQLGGSLTAEQQAAYFARLQSYMDAVMADGLWGKLDALHLHGAPTEELARTNWKERWPISIEDL